MTIWSMRIACWIPKATNKHSECFSNARMVARTGLTLTLYYIAVLVLDFNLNKYCP